MRILKLARKVSEPSTSSRLIRELLNALDSRSVNYCHWKSNWKMLDWLKGEGDLDLLVSQKDIGEFAAVLHELGFKKALSPAAKELPGILNFYGYDEDTKRLIHVHAHYKLVFGHDLSKNYRLPVEELLISSAIRKDPIFVASPELESILFVVRMVLKYSVLESLVRRAMGKTKSHSRLIANELAFLSSESDELHRQRILSRHFPMIELGLFEECSHSLSDHASVWARVAAKRKLERSLSAYSRVSPAAEKFQRLKGRLTQAVRAITRCETTRKKCEHGGAVIAIVGGDGAGKTTCVKEIGKWLSKDLDTRFVHLGKPPKSFLTLAAAAALKVEKRAREVVPSTSGISEKVASPSQLQRLRWCCTARDRYLLYRKICRWAANGTIVISDRYPLPNVHLMDNAKIRAVDGAFSPTNTGTRLGRIESWYYRQILPPDATFVLRVDPYTATKRKTDEDRGHVFSRSKALWDLNWQSTRGVQLIDAGRPLPEVVAELRRGIWNAF